MKKALYIVLICVASIINFFIFGLLLSNALFVGIPTLIVCGFLWIRQIIHLRKAGTKALKKMIRRRIALIFLIPVAVFLVLLIWLVIGLMMII